MTEMDLRKNPDAPLDEAVAPVKGARRPTPSMFGPRNPRVTCPKCGKPNSPMAFGMATTCTRCGTRIEAYQSTAAPVVPEPAVEPAPEVQP